MILNCHLLHGETEEDLEKRDKQLISLFHHSSVTLCTVKKQDGSTDEQNFMAADQFNEARDLRFASFLPWIGVLFTAETKRTYRSSSATII